MKQNRRRQIAAAARNIAARLATAEAGQEPRRDGPELDAGTIHYEIAERNHAITCGGIGAVHQPAKQVGLAKASTRSCRSRSGGARIARRTTFSTSRRVTSVVGSHPGHRSSSVDAALGVYFQVTLGVIVAPGKSLSFVGQAGGLAALGANGTWGDLYSDDIVWLFTDTVSFQVNTTLFYTNVNFFDGSAPRLLTRPPRALAGVGLRAGYTLVAACFAAARWVTRLDDSAGP